MKILIFISFLGLTSISQAQKPIFTSAKVKAVKVYNSSAQIQQQASINLPKGTSEIIVKNIADDIQENSILINAPASLTILSVQFTNNYIAEFELNENNPTIKKVRDSIIFYTKSLQKLEIEKTSLYKTLEVLDKNQQVYGQNSGLNFTELVKLIDYYKTKRTEINLQITSLDDKVTLFNETLKKLNTKLEIGTKNAEKTSNGKLIIQVINDLPSKTDLFISYLSNNASWTPFYDLRANIITEPISLMYKAQVTQNTGIDWLEAKLSLSSENPNQNNTEPILYPWILQYKLPMAQYIKRSTNHIANEVLANAPTPLLENKASDMMISTVNTSINENKLSLTFDTATPYTILSNGKVHNVALKQVKLPALYQYYAAPKIENEAFLIAKITDYAKYNLLEGQANIIFEDTYIGKTNINPSATTDTLKLSMGRDKKITISRNKVLEKSGIKFLSTKKEQTFTYEVIIRNNKKESIQLLLNDQYPLSNDKEIEINLLQSDKAEINTETGNLLWLLSLKPYETKKIRFSYTIKYAKEKVIDNL
ncbi:MAG: mucoidy inhibitor MuiA family protein [Sphingobacteriales bacterium]|nr:MAG: mucoidy inhibitor MuiA family protein [Sphingobacteriales bacterium]TAF80499.1 MAG: mucoidy inhibitor MuiA family protein [Sphingobacteriales bacterium]